MTTTLRELPHIDLPRPLIYVTGTLCGVLAAMVVQVLLSRAGMTIAGLWTSLSSGQTMQIRTAGAWWMMSGIAFLASALIGAVLSRASWPWHRLRALRWLAGAAIVAGLAEVGHMASVMESAGGAHVALTLAALSVAALMALFGAYFAVKR